MQYFMPLPEKILNTKINERIRWNFFINGWPKEFARLAQGRKQKQYQMNQHIIFYSSKPITK